VQSVVQYDAPASAQDYVHRVGRTARAGRGGLAVSLVSQYDIELVREIEGLIEEKLVEFETDEKTVLKDLSYVYAARRAAVLALEEALEEKEAQRK
jgi:ATP-dependent RNA helicase DDX49/DBP8